VAGRWFSPDSSTNKTNRHDITEILFKVALNTINQTNKALTLTLLDYKRYGNKGDNWVVITHFKDE